MLASINCHCHLLRYSPLLSESIQYCWSTLFLHGKGPLNLNFQINNDPIIPQCTFYIVLMYKNSTDISTIVCLKLTIS